jgi:hypothetical protein
MHQLLVQNYEGTTSGPGSRHFQGASSFPVHEKSANLPPLMHSCCIL